MGRRLPTNITLEPGQEDLLRLVREDYGSLSEYVSRCLNAFASARLRNRQKLTDLELEATLLRARVAESRHVVTRAQASIDMDEERLGFIEEKLAEAAQLVRETRERHLTVPQVVELVFAATKSPGSERAEKVREMANAYGVDRRDLARAVFERQRELDLAKQTDLRVLPQAAATSRKGRGDS